MGSLWVTCEELAATDDPAPAAEEPVPPVGDPKALQRAAATKFEEGLKRPTVRFGDPSPRRNTYAKLLTLRSARRRRAPPTAALAAAQPGLAVGPDALEEAARPEHEVEGL